jgi:hypothetical protein
MPTHSDDRILWTLIGLGLFIAAKAIPANLQYIRQLTEVKSEGEPSQRSNEDVERALKTETLEKLAAGRSYEIRSCAIKIIAERCSTSPARSLLLEDLASRDPERRDKAIQAVSFLTSHRSVERSHNRFFFTDVPAFHAIITALVNLLPEHQNVSASTATDDQGKVECYEMDFGLPVMAESRFEARKKQAEQMAREYAKTSNDRTLLCRIPAQQQQLLALIGFTPLTEYFFNDCAQQWLREDGASVVMDSVPDIPDRFRRKLSEVCCSAEPTGGLSGWRAEVSTADRVRHLESLLKALWSCRSMAVQASSMKTAIFLERDALENTPSRDVYDAHCQERADYFRQLTGGLFQQALQESAEGATVIGGVGLDRLKKNNSKKKVLPPSPVRPFCRPPQERMLLDILTKLLNVHSVETALSTGLVLRWLCRYPFPCMLTSNSKQHDVVAFLREKAWASDDPVMAQLMHIITSVPQGLDQLRGCRLTRISNFHAYWREGNWYVDWSSAQNHDVVMTGGEDTAGILPSRDQSSQADHRPGSSWSRRHPRDSRAEEIQRRRRREAMVLSDGEGPLTEDNILQRENSRVALVPGQEPGIEEQLAQLNEEIDREDEDGMAHLIDRDSPTEDARQPPRQPLADITRLTH